MSILISAHFSNASGFVSGARRHKLLFTLLSADLNICQIFIILGDGAVVCLTLVVVMEPLEDFLYLSSHGNGCSNGMSAVQYIVQVLDMQVNLKAGLSLPAIIMGALAFMTVEPARPPLIA